jgi:hypothetical protein
MYTSPSFEWQVFEERDWEDAVASGFLAGDKAHAQAPPPTYDPSPRVHLPWLSLAGVAVALLFLWMVYAPWSAQRADAMPIEDNSAVQTIPVQVKAKDGYLRFSQLDPASRSPQRLRILSAYFQFEYDLGDQDSVTVAAAQIDPFYRALRQAVGLGEPVGLIQIDVTPRTITTGWQLSRESVLIPSPAFAQIPAESASATVVQSLRVALTHLVLTERLAAAPIHPKWNFLVDGLRHWLQSCFDPQGEHDCEERMAAATVLNATPPLSLANLTFTDSDWVAATWGVERIRSAKWLMAYLVDVYGVEKLPVLLDGQHQHHTWQTLTPAVFDLSFEQLEQEWHQADAVRSSG